MLVLTRKVDQAIRIGANVEVFVVEIRGDQVRLGTRAPKDIPIHRAEIADQIEAQGQRLPDLALATAPAA